MKDGDARLQHGMDSQLIAQRARHNPLVWENVRHGTRTIAARMVVHPDGKIREQMQNDGLWGAYESISKAIEMITAGLGAKTFDPSRAAGSTAGLDNGADLQRKYYAWYDLCKNRHLAPLLVKRMVIDGISFGNLEREYSFRRGSVKLKVWEALSVWSEV